MNASKEFQKEVGRVYELVTDTVDFKSGIVFLDEDGSNIMVATKNDNGSW